MISPSAISPLNRRVVEEGGFDPDAQAFITAAGITGATQQEALNQLVLDLKGNGSTTNNNDVWNKLQVVYPFCPIDNSTANLSAFKWNLVNPLDTDAAFRATFINSPSATVNGLQGNGINQRAEIYYNPSLHSSLNNAGITASSKTENFNTTAVISSFVGGNIFELIIDSDSSYSFINQDTYPKFNPTTSVGIFTASRTSSTEVLTYLNGSLVDTSTVNSSAAPNQTCSMLCRKDDGVFGLYDSKLYNFIAIHEGLTANEAKDLSDAISTYNTTLGR